MGPCKFADIQKTANDLLSDDFQTATFEFKAKQGTQFDGASVTTTVDVNFKNPVVTPAKVSWKFPKPFGCTAIAIDKLEMDKGGKYKLETSMPKLYPNLKVEAKSNLASPLLSGMTTGATFTGIKDTQLKFETKLSDPANFSFEASRTLIPGANLALKGGAATLAAPDIGLNYATGPFFASLLVKEKFQAYTVHAHYKANDKVKLAGTANIGGKANGQFSLGLAYALAANTNFKAKYDKDHVHAAIKHTLVKGFKVNTGVKYNIKTQATGWGFQLSLE